MAIKLPGLTPQPDPNVARLRREVEDSLRAIVRSLEANTTAAVAAADHGDLNGLTDDDHTQYPLADASRGFSAALPVNAVTYTGTDGTAGYVLKTAGDGTTSFVDPNTLVSGAFTKTTYELDFSAEATASLSTGGNTIDGNTWTVNLNGSDTLDLTNGTGLQYVASATSGAFTGSTTTATYLYTSMATLYAELACDPRALLMMEIYAPSISFSANATLLFGAWGASGTPTSSGTRILAAERANVSATEIWRTRGQTLGYNAQLSSNVWGLMDHGNSYAGAFADTWGSAWPTSYTNHMNAVSGLTSSCRDPVSRLVIAFATNGTAGTYTATVQRIRITAYQP